MHRYKELVVWQKAVDLTVDVYTQTRKFPSEEKFGIVSQINKSAVSIPSNIAEGAGRNSKNEFNHFLGIAIGSSFELETQLIISNRLGFINEPDPDLLMKNINEIQNMLFALQKKL